MSDVRNASNIEPRENKKWRGALSATLRHGNRLRSTLAVRQLPDWIAESHRAWRNDEIDTSRSSNRLGELTNIWLVYEGSADVTVRPVRASPAARALHDPCRARDELLQLVYHRRRIRSRCDHQPPYIVTRPRQSASRSRASVVPSALAVLLAAVTTMTSFVPGSTNIDWP